MTTRTTQPITIVATKTAGSAVVPPAASGVCRSRRRRSYRPPSWPAPAVTEGRGVVAPTACEPSAGGMTLSGCPIMMEAVLDGTTDPQAVHAAAEVRDRHAAGAWREAADRAGPRARRGPHDDLS